ncbi:hypothetical protein EJB05_29071 [Eragrostis curvula]|uniref:Uncharacterized protein n=1 Tax=Eragrostis curvula TaxID=38414 RepID=A0A5J9UTB7_9POAL|nr:hypothetical protein EJB05_29071 [Eragrostis curvula]
MVHTLFWLYSVLQRGAREGACRDSSLILIHRQPSNAVSSFCFLQVGWSSSHCFMGAAGHSVHTRQLFDVMPPCIVCLSSFDLPMLHCVWKGWEKGGRKKYKEANESLWNFIRSSHPGAHIFLLSSSFCHFKETLNAKYKSLRSRQLLVLFSLFTILVTSTNRLRNLLVLNERSTSRSNKTWQLQSGRHSVKQLSGAPKILEFVVLMSLCPAK